MSFAALRSKYRKKQGIKRDNVEVAKHLINHTSTTDEAARESLEEEPPSSNRDFNLPRFSRSETALDWLPPAGDAREHDEPSSPVHRVGSLSGTMGKFMRTGSTASRKSIPPVSEQPEDKLKVSFQDSRAAPMCLDLPKLGPPFGIENSIFQSLKSIAEEGKPGPGSTSSQEACDQTSSCYSPNSSKSSMSSAPSPGSSPQLNVDTQVKRDYSVVSPVTAGVFDEDGQDSKQKPMASATNLVRNYSLRSPVMKNKPLPPEPPRELSPVRESPSSPPNPQSPQSLDNGQEAVSHRDGEPTLSQAAADLVGELAKIAEARNSGEESPVLLLQAPKIVGEAVSPLRFAAKPLAEEKKLDWTPDAKRSDTPYTLRSETGSESHGEKGKKPSTELWRSWTSQVKSSGKRRFRFTIPVPGFGRKTQVASYHRPTRSWTPTTTQTVERHIDSQISRALNLDEEEEEEAETAWPTLLPLKAVKQLGIPLMSSSRIPRLSSSETERTERNLRLQLPRLQTDRYERPTSSVDGSKFVVEPGDGPQETLFIDSPIEESDEACSDANKIVIGISKLDYLFPDTSSQEAHRLRVPPVKSRPRLSELNLMTAEVFELDGGISPVVKPIDLPMPAGTPDAVALAIMGNVDTLDELFNCAIANKQFFRVFKENELRLMKDAMFKMSAPAWELREMSPPWGVELQGLKDPDAPVPEYTPSLYLRHHARDIFTLVKLKSLILARCGSFLRRDTIRGLAGADAVRAAEIDEAFWRIWTFCRIFGSGKNRENDINGQIDWLNGGYLANKQKKGATVLLAEPFFSMNNVLFDPPAGFGRGNGRGLSHSQLYDMTEIWNCFGVLLQAVHAKCAEARQAGIFNDADIKEGDITKEEAILGKCSL
jgi:hypothetical protein